MSRKRAISASAAAMEDWARDDWWRVERWVCAVSWKGRMSKRSQRMKRRRERNSEVTTRRKKDKAAAYAWDRAVERTWLTLL